MAELVYPPTGSKYCSLFLYSLTESSVLCFLNDGLPDEDEVESQVLICLFFMVKKAEYSDKYLSVSPKPCGDGLVTAFTAARR